MLFIVVAGVMALLVASPAFQRVLVYPQTEFFTEAWILGSQHIAENYPFNITTAVESKIFLGLSNHLGNFSYYKVQVKLRNQNQSGADSFNRTSSNLPSLYNIYAFVSDNGTWELPVSFSLNYVSEGNESQVDLYNLVYNGITLDLSGYVATFDAEREQRLVNLFFEVWIYDDVLGEFRYHERFVGLWLNLQ